MQNWAFFCDRWYLVFLQKTADAGPLAPCIRYDQNESVLDSTSHHCSNVKPQSEEKMNDTLLIILLTALATITITATAIGCLCVYCKRKQVIRSRGKSHSQNAFFCSALILISFYLLTFLYVWNWKRLKKILKEDMPRSMTSRNRLHLKKGECRLSAIVILRNSRKK